MNEIKNESANAIRKELNEAYKMLSVISVSGSAVDVMAGARIHLKEAFKLAGDKSALWDAYKLAEKEESNG